MRILGDNFVLGRTIEEALGRAAAYEAQGYRFSYDMLEGAICGLTSISWSPRSRCAATSPIRRTSRSARRIEKQKRHWVHIASAIPTDVEPCIQQKIPVIWVNRHGEKIEGAKKPDAEVRTFREAGKLLKAA